MSPHSSVIEPKRPYYLFEDVPDDVVDLLGPLVPEYKVAHSPHDAHDSDFDAIVSFNPEPTHHDESLPILSFGARMIYLRRYHSAGPSGNYTIHLETGPSSDVVNLLDPDDDDPKLSELVRETIYPVIKDSREVWNLDYGRYPDRFTRPLVSRGREKRLHALITARGTRDGNIDAGLLLALPKETKRPDRWLKKFQSILHSVHPETFPLIDDWTTDDPRWLPLEAETLLERKRQSEAELKETVEQLEAEIQETKQQLDKILVGNHDTGVQRLLTAQGDDLTAAVKEALETLGYAVQDMDAPKLPGEPRLEDLRITLPARKDWAVLAEVKGYKNDAKVNDLQQLPGRPLRKYVEETGRPPSSLWHIVNTRIEENPSARKRTHRHFNKEDTALIADHEGLILETRDLFEAAKAVDRGDHTPEEIRSAVEASELYWTVENGLANPGYES